MKSILCALRYTIDRSEKNFQLDLSVEVCIDHVCEVITILDHTIIPIPVCNDNFTLPGGDTVNGFLNELGREAGGTGVNLILEYLGLSVSITCMLRFIK